MMMKRSSWIRSLAVAALGSLVLSAVAALPAASHGSATVGDYKLTFGARVEPLLDGEPNWIELRILNAETNTPVEGVEKTLTLMASHLEHEMELPLSPVRGEPGLYASLILFTMPGKFTIHTEGNIEGVEAHEHWVAEVRDRASISFPQPSVGGGTQ